MGHLDVVIIKPSKYGLNGFVDRFRKGFFPNATLPYMKSITPQSIAGVTVRVVTIDEYVQTDLKYLEQLKSNDGQKLIALVGVQSHQFHRAVDLAGFARDHGSNVVIGGPHPMTCDTSMLQNKGVAFAQAEAEIIWESILVDATIGELKPVYGSEQRWARSLEAPPLIPPSRTDIKRYMMSMLGVYPARGCPFTCNFCSVIKIAGRSIRSESISVTLETLRRAKDSGIKNILFTSDNFNKFPDAPELLRAMIEEKINLPFFVQCDTQIGKQEELVELMARAGCFQIFLGVESFDRKTLLGAHKGQNHPEVYRNIVKMCEKNGILSHFSNIIGFPGQSRDQILDHVKILNDLSPDIASFYILTPIPGTDQYAEFMKSGVLNKPNLDRFDTTCSVWKHDVLPPEEIENLLYECYKKFYSVRNIGRKLLRKTNGGLLFRLGLPIYANWSARMRTHPMSGGIGRVRLDSASEYLTRRKERFGFELFPLPNNLELSESDRELNSRVKLEKVVV